MLLCCFVVYLVRATVDIVQWFCDVYGVYCGYNNSRYIAMVLCWVWRNSWLQQQKKQCNDTVLFLDFIVVTATVDIVHCSFVLCGVYCGYRNSRYSSMLLCCVWSLLRLKQEQIQCNANVLCWSLLWLQQQQIQCNGTVLCVEFIVVRATVDIVQWYCVFLEFLLLEKYQVLCNGTVLCVEFIVVRATVGIVQWYSVVCGVYCGYSNNCYSAMTLCCVWSLLWLQQQQIQCIVTMFCVEFIVFRATIDTVQYYWIACGVNCGQRNGTYSAMLLCCVWSLLCLQTQQIQCNICCVCVEFIVVEASVDIGQLHCVIFGEYCG